MSAEPRCAVCSSVLDELFRAPGQRSLTSLCTVVDAPTIVRHCVRCGHVQSPPLPEIEAFYGTSYRILLDAEDEDQVVEVGPNGPVYRLAFQADVLLERLALPLGAKVLDYGAAKAGTMRHLLRMRPDLEVSVFDVSDMYRSLWSNFLPEDRTATFEVPASWWGRFDAVVSFFMLEHVEAPAVALDTMRSLALPGGSIYVVVPNVLTNPGDLVVVDHVNHFVVESLQRALELAGLEAIEVDADRHRGALVASGRCPRGGAGPGRSASAQAPAPRPESVAAVVSLADFWRGVGTRIEGIAAAINGEPFAIYGAGFYGSYLLAALGIAPVVFIDRNPHLVGRSLFDVPVVGPDDVPDEVRHVVVGLNPLHARASIAESTRLRAMPVAFHYLDGEDGGR